MYKLKPSIITPPFGVKNYKGKCVDLEKKHNEKAIKNTLQHLFNVNILKDEWKLIWNTIKDYSKPMGLIGLDSPMSTTHYHGLMFNLGIPKLRSRRFYYMPRIYMYLSNDTDNFCRFYNSHYDINDEDCNLIMRDKVYAYHPHVSEGNPCLGAYATDLSQAHHTGNIMMYLITALKFVNTWNANSPFFQIHREKQVFKLETKTVTNGQIFVVHGGIRDGSFEKYKRFALENIEKIDSGSVMSDLKHLKDIYNYRNHHYENAKDEIKKNVDTEFRSYLSTNQYVAHDRADDYPRTFSGQHSIIPVNNIFIYAQEHTVNIFDKDVQTNTVYRKLTKATDYHHNRMVPINRLRKQLLSNISYLLIKFRKHMMFNKLISESFIDTNEFSIFDIYFKYLAPHVGEEVELLNEINALNENDQGKSGGLQYLLWHSSQLHDVDIKNYNVQKYIDFDDKRHARGKRVRNFLLKSIRKNISKESVMNYMDNWVKEAFKYELNPVEGTMYNGNVDYTEIVYATSGIFWRNSEYNRFDDDTIQTIGLMDGVPESVISLVEKYEKVKSDFIEEDAKQLINKHNQQIGELEKYVRNKTKNTSEDTQQVHLSFE